MVAIVAMCTSANVLSLGNGLASKVHSKEKVGQVVMCVMFKQRLGNVSALPFKMSLSFLFFRCVMFMKCLSNHT